MTSFERPDLPVRFELELRSFLEDDAGLDRPDYLADILVRSAAAPQRPAWTFPERWLPMTAAVTGVAGPARVPWRAVALVALLLVALASAATLFVGSRPRVPAPYGTARNGLVAYEKNGDIYTTDPATGISTAIVTGQVVDTDPVWSRDGSRLAFVRSGSGAGVSLVVANADGSHPVAVTQDTVHGIASPVFSPDGRQILFLNESDPTSILWIASVDGASVRPIDTGIQLDHPANWGITIDQPSWLPPSGADIVFAGTPPDGAASGIYAVDIATQKVRAIVPPAHGVGVGVPAVSPDGRWVAYARSLASVADRNTSHVHVVRIDGSSDRTLPMPAGATFQDSPAWSNDGTRLVVTRGYSTRSQDMAIAILPADGSGVGVESQHGLTGCCDTRLAWAPADDQILVLPEDQSSGWTGQLLIDSATGVATPASWAGLSDPAWQRRAP